MSFHFLPLNSITDQFLCDDVSFLWRSNDKLKMMIWAFECLQQTVWVVTLLLISVSLGHKLTKWKSDEKSFKKCMNPVRNLCKIPPNEILCIFYSNIFFYSPQCCNVFVCLNIVGLCFRKNLSCTNLIFCPSLYFITSSSAVKIIYIFADMWLLIKGLSWCSRLDLQGKNLSISAQH